MSAYRLPLANRRTILLAVLSLIASLVVVSSNAPVARAAGETISFDNPTSTVGENGTSINVDVTLDNPTSTPEAGTFSVEVTVTGGGSAGAGDYTFTDPTLVSWTNPASLPLTTSVTVNIDQDTLVEGDETIVLGFQNESNVTATGTHTVTITDDDTATVAFSSAVSDDDEGTTPHAVGISLSTTGGSTLADQLIVNIDDAGSGTATITDDYSYSTGSVTFPAGSGNGAAEDFNINIVPDTIDEPDETINLLLGLIVGEATASGTTAHTHTINDDDPTPTIAVNDPTVDEDAGTIDFTVTRTGATSQTVTFSYATSDISATAGSDYTATSGSDGSIAPGATTDTISVPINDDGIDEPNEMLKLTISGAANATISDAEGTGTINDNDAKPTLTVSSPASVDESGNLVFIVTRSGNNTEDPINFNYTFGGGTATDGVDYDDTGGSGTITPGAPGTTTITVPIFSDGDYEPSETVKVSLTVTSGNANNPAGPGTGTITDDDPAKFWYTSAGSNAPEQISPHTITITLVGPAGTILFEDVDLRVEVDGSFAGGATGADYSIADPIVTFHAGDSVDDTQPLDITITNDALVESNEQFRLNLYVDSGHAVTTGSPSHTVTIIDDESNNIVVTPTNSSTVVSESGTTDTFDVTLTQAPIGGTVTVDLTETMAGDEFNISPTQVTFPAGTNTPKTITVTPVDDDFVDGAQLGQVTLTASGPGYAGVTATEAVTINDDDVAGVTIVESGDVTAVTEGDSGDTYTVVLNAKPTSNVIVDTDYNTAELTVSPGSLTFTSSNWDTPQTVTVTANEDGIDELVEMHTITHTVTSSDPAFDGVSAADVDVTVGDADELLVTIDGPTVGAPGFASTFTATVNAGGTGAITYDWTVFKDGNEVATSDKSVFEFTPTEGGTYILQAIVGDSQGQNPAEFIQFKVLGDIGGSVFVGDIIWLAEEGITKGCNPPDNDEFCPTDFVTREQMAAFLVRFLGLTDDGGGNKFIDDDGSIFESDIAKLAAAGITKGCNPPANTMFCPTDRVTRAQMAAFLVRALRLFDDGGGNKFIDDDGSIFESDIAKLAAAGITKGCNPPTNDKFCPNDFVTRGQMAAFIRRSDAILNP
jgi:hypothetical protein